MNKIIIFIFLSISLYAGNHNNSKKFIGVIMSQNKIDFDNETKDTISYGINYKWQSGGNLYGGMKTDIYKTDNNYITDLYPFMGMKISKNLKVDIFYGYNLSYNNNEKKSNNGSLWGYALSMEFSNKYEIGIQYKEVNNDMDIVKYGLFFNIRLN